MNQIILVTGAASSGKSEWAEFLATQTQSDIIYVATAKVDPTDAEWSAKIAKHQQRRPGSWQTIVAPTDLPGVIIRAKPSDCLLVDSLGTWIANLLGEDQQAWQQKSGDFLAALKQTEAKVIIVGEETGWGVVPAYETGRIFRDRVGKLIRQIGSFANPVYLVTGGHAVNLKQIGVPLPSYHTLNL
jgi:adenosylcobinamide kinase/adenosylcobinamide-phosphate guanylyltransferase